MISISRQNPYTPSFKRNLKPFEIERLASGDVKTLLDVGVKTGQGIITPDRGALGHLGEYIQANINRDKLGFLPAVLEFFTDYKKLSSQKPRKPYLRLPQDTRHFINKDPKGMLGVAFDIGSGRLPQRVARTTFMIPLSFGPELETLGRVIPKEIEASYVVESLKRAERL